MTEVAFLGDLIVEVTKEDILDGQAGHKSWVRAKHCPLALALNRLGYRDAVVGRWYWYVRGTKYRLTPEASDFVIAADKDQESLGATKLKPAKFLLSLQPVENHYG